MKRYLVHTPLGWRSGSTVGDVVALSADDAAPLLACGAISEGAAQIANIEGRSAAPPALTDLKFAQLVEMAAAEGLVLDPKVKSKAGAIAAIEAHREKLAVEREAASDAEAAARAAAAPIS